MRERANHRFASSTEAVCRVPATPLIAAIIDVSSEGCRGRANSYLVQRGATILVSFASGVELGGQVVWVDGAEFGVRVHVTIPGETVAQLLDDR